ncbi:hypothetical protein AAG906_018594 [Vitis piasezkii]
MPSQILGFKTPLQALVASISTIEPPTSTIETPTLIIETLPHSTVPHDPTFENIPKVSSPLVTKHLIHDSYQLPPIHNHGKQPKCYSLDIETQIKRSFQKPLKGFSNELLVHHIPTNVKEALQNPKWTRILVSLPENHKTMGRKWVFSIRYKANGSIERYKVRLVIFSLVAKVNTIRVLLSLVANLD